jgi:hypothetical protein
MTKRPQKYIGQIYDGRWEVVKYETTGFKRGVTFKNIYNNKILRLSYMTFLSILKGNTSVSSAIATKLGYGRRNNKFRKKKRFIKNDGEQQSFIHNDN